MLTTVKFYVTENCQKNLLKEGKDAKDYQSIDLDINSEIVIDRVKMSGGGKATIYIDDNYYHYDENDNWIAYSARFEKIPTEDDLILFFSGEIEKSLDDEKAAERRKEKDAENEKKRRIEEEKEAKKQADEYIERQAKKGIYLNHLNAFIDKSGSETIRLRRQLGYDFFDLACQEYIDTIEPTTIEKIETTEESQIVFSYIDKPSLELMQMICGLRQILQGWGYIENVNINAVLITEAYDYDFEPQKYEGLEIDYFVFGVKKTRIYRTGTGK